MKYFKSSVSLLVALAVAVACAPLKKNSGASGAPANFIVDPVSATKVETTRLDAATQQPAERTITLKACLRDAGALRPIFNQPFAIQGGDTEAVKTTDSEGCLYWPEKVPFNYVASETYITLDRVIAARGVFSGSQKVSLAVNPWRTSGDSVVDLRSQSVANISAAPSALQAQANQNLPRLDITGFSYDFIGRTFAIDDYLTLVQKRKFQFRVKPVIRYPNETEKGVSYEDVLSGQYKLKVLFETSPLPEESSLAPTMLAYSETAVQARDGLIVAEVELPFTFEQLPLVASRNRIVIKLESMDASEPLAPVTLGAPFDPLGAVTSLALVPETQDLDSIRDGLLNQSTKQGYQMVQYGRSSTLQVPLKGDPTDELTAFYQLKTLLDPAAASPAPIVPADINILAKDPAKAPDSLKAKLCGILGVSATPKPGKWNQLWQKQPSDLNLCQKTPSDYLSFTSFKRVEKVTGPLEEQSGDIIQISVSASFGTSHDESTSFSKGATTSTSVNVGASLGGSFGGSFGPLKLFGASANVSAGWSRGHSWFSTVSIGEDVTNSVHEGSSIAKNFSAEELDFSFPALTRACVVVSNLKDPKQPARIGCDNGPAVAEKASESWYYISDSSDRLASVIRDTMQLNERPWSRVIRGRQNFLFLKGLLEDRKSIFVLQSIDSMPKEDAALKQVNDPSALNQGSALDDIFHREGIFPGILGN